MSLVKHFLAESCLNVWWSDNQWVKEIASETEFRSLTCSIFANFFVLRVSGNCHVTESGPLYRSMPVADLSIFCASRQLNLLAAFLYRYGSTWILEAVMDKIGWRLVTVTTIFFECNFAFVKCRRTSLFSNHWTEWRWLLYKIPFSFWLLKISQEQTSQHQFI